MLSRDDRPVRVLFVCFDNALGHIAESVMRSLRNPRLAASSAGVEPLPVRPLVIDYLRSRHMPADGLEPKWISETDCRRFHFIITLCERSAGHAFDLSTDAVLATWNLEPLGVQLGDPRNAGRALRNAFWTLTRRIKIFASLPLSPRIADTEHQDAWRGWRSAS